MTNFTLLSILQVMLARRLVTHGYFTAHVMLNGTRKNENFLGTSYQLPHVMQILDLPHAVSGVIVFVIVTVISYSG